MSIKQPHLRRSTNMAIEDAGALASALAAHPGEISAALATFERRRTVETAREVLFSRHLGRVKQMLDPAAGPSDPEVPTANLKPQRGAGDCGGRRHRQWPGLGVGERGRAACAGPSQHGHICCAATAAGPSGFLML